MKYITATTVKIVILSRLIKTNFFNFKFFILNTSKNEFDEVHKKFIMIYIICQLFSGDFNFFNRFFI